MHDTPELTKQVQKFVGILSLNPTLDDVVSEVHRLCGSIERALENGIPAVVVKDMLLPAYHLHSRSEFINRLQLWPRGYPGDFETVEWIVNSKPRASNSDPIYWLEWYALNAPIAQQHRNKLIWQRSIIEEVASVRGKILSIGCGGCADLASSPPFIRTCNFVLMDADGDALALAEQRLQNAMSLQLVKASIKKGIREAIQLGPYDLILCGGVFDYLPTEFIQSLLSQLVSSLSNTGRLVFTNISVNNPHRTWMENFTSWRLIHRSEADIVALLPEKCPPLNITQDPSGLTFLCSLTNNGWL